MRLDFFEREERYLVVSGSIVMSGSFPYGANIPLCISLLPGQTWLYSRGRYIDGRHNIARGRASHDILDDLRRMASWHRDPQRHSESTLLFTAE